MSSTSTNTNTNTMQQQTRRVADRLQQQSSGSSEFQPRQTRPAGEASEARRVNPSDGAGQDGNKPSGSRPS